MSRRSSSSNSAANGQAAAAEPRSLDRAVLRLSLVAEAFGRGSSDAVAATHVAEDANTRVVELSGRLERNETLLRLFQSKLDHFGRGQVIGSGTATPPAG